MHEDIWKNQLTTASTAQMPENRHGRLYYYPPQKKLRELYKTFFVIKVKLCTHNTLQSVKISKFAVKTYTDVQY